MALITTVSMDKELMKFLDSEFLDRSEALLIHGEGAKKSHLKQNHGKTYTFTKRDPKQVATTPLTEGENPAESGKSSGQVTAELKTYGDWEKISSLFKETSIDKGQQETIEVLAQQAAETIDALIRNALHAGATTMFANGKSALSALTNDDVLTLKEVKKAKRDLKKRNAKTYGDGYYIGKIGPDTAYNLMNDGAWIEAQKYTGRKELYKGEIGTIAGVRFLECSSNQKTEQAGSVTVYSNFIHGQQAFGTIALEGINETKLIIKNPDKHDTSNALNMFSTAGWKAEAFATAVLDPEWIINIKTGAKD